MLLPELWGIVYACLTWDTAFSLRLSSKALLHAWDICPKWIDKVESRRTFICVNRCMVCNRYEDNMVTMTVPWAIVPPKGVVVCCNRLSCKYPVLWSFQQNDDDVPFAHVMHPVLPHEVTITRSSGTKQIANCKTSFVAKPPGAHEWHVLVWWLQGSMFYSKYVPFSSLEEQASGPLQLALHV